MKTFQCTRLRLCNYLMDREFFPYCVDPVPYHIYPAKDMKGNRRIPIGATTGTRTRTPFWQQILNLPRLPVPTLWHRSPAEAGQVIIPRG